MHIISTEIRKKVEILQRSRMTSNATERYKVIVANMFYQTQTPNFQSVLLDEPFSKFF